MRDLVVRFLESPGSVRISTEDDQEYLAHLEAMNRVACLAQEIVGEGELEEFAREEGPWESSSS